MKKVIILLILFFELSALSFSQQVASESFKTFYKTCKKDDQIKAFNVPMIFFKHFIDVDDKEIRKLKNRISSVRIIISEDNNENLTNNYEKSISSDIYRNLIVINEDSSEIKIKIKEGKKGISEIVITIDEKDEQVILSLKGKFKYKNLNEIIKMSSLIDV